MSAYPLSASDKAFRKLLIKRTAYIRAWDEQRRDMAKRHPLFHCNHFSVKPRNNREQWRYGYQTMTEESDAAKFRRQELEIYLSMLPLGHKPSPASYMPA